MIEVIRWVMFPGDAQVLRIMATSGATGGAKLVSRKAVDINLVRQHRGAFGTFSDRQLDWACSAVA